jgi:Domain of unknown function (DUF4349)
MTALAPLSTILPARRRPAAWAGFLAAGACLLAAGCSASSESAPSASGAGAAVHAAAGVPAQAAPVLAPAANGLSAAGKSARNSLRLTALVPPSQSIIYTATLTIRAANAETAVSRATRLAESAGGYVSAEHSSLTRGRTGTTQALVSIQFKIPVSAYPGTLAALAGLGTKLSETQQTQDVTQTVADVNSRVASAQAAIVQLRKLLTRAGTVNGLLTVQDQINYQEANLEALQSQQRALAGETTYATISTTILGPPPAHHHRHHKAAGGFLGGLTAGWHALRRVVAALLTVTGAALPFAVILAVVAAASYAARRRLARRRAGASPAQ